MLDVHVIGASRIAPAPVDIKPERWTHRPARLARMDRASALALVAADGALADARLDPATWEGERVAVVVGTAFGCHAVNEEYYRGLLAEGARGASPRLFAYTLPSSPAGELTIHYGARGPAETTASGRHAGLEAIERAARLCATDRADYAIAVAVDTAGATAASLGSALVDGAAAIVLARVAPGASLARLVGAATLFRARAPSEAARAAIAMAADEAGVAPPTEIAPVDGDDAVTPVATLIDALRGGRARFAVAADRAGGASALAFASAVAP